MDTATCTRCQARKPIGDFPADSTRTTGHYPHCKACRAESDRARYQRRKANANVKPLPKRKPVDLHRETALLDPPPSDRPGMGPHLAELERTLERLDLQDVDAALAGLARTLARGMDGAFGDARTVAMIAPKYLAALKALCVTRDTAPAAAEEGPSLRLAAY